MQFRIEKYLADMGIGTRTEVKNYIKKGLVRVNDEIIKNAGIKVDSEKDTVYFDGQPVSYVTYEYYIINKPAGVISATEDRREATVVDMIDSARKDLFPVGRLDRDTEGLLLITNDGMLAHNLLSPKKHVDKTYYVETDGLLKVEYVDLFKSGLVIDEEWTALPATLNITEATDKGSKAFLTIHEGKFHQVKRMMEAVGNTVTYLKRISMGALVLPKDLAPGEYRTLTKEELDSINR